MDFARAKLLINPDPTWWPSRDSAEHQEILTLMKQSGTVLLTDQIQNAPIPEHIHKNGIYINPLNAPIKHVKTNRVSKRDFHALPSNKMKIGELLGINGIPMQIPEREKRPITAIHTAPPSNKISKKEFLNLGENKVYIEQHIDYYKK